MHVHAPHMSLIFQLEFNPIQTKHLLTIQYVSSVVECDVTMNKTDAVFMPLGLLSFGRRHAKCGCARHKWRCAHRVHRLGDEGEMGAYNPSPRI